MRVPRHIVVAMTTKIGELVRLNLPQLLEFCTEHDPEELARLSTADYSKETFGLSTYAFLTTPAEAAWVKKDTGYPRHWVEVYRVRDQDLVACREWKEGRHRARFLTYLLELGLNPRGVDEAELATAVTASEAEEAGSVTPTEPVGPFGSLGGTRYKKHAIGNAQNSAVRFVLGALPEESFTKADWLEVLRTFDHLCAYCGERRALVMDHAVPISKESLGEHRLGNLVPACHPCNSAKGQKAYDTYLRGNQRIPDARARITVIEGHMARHGYRPLTTVLDQEGVDRVRAALDELREAIATAAASAVSTITGAMPSES